MVFEFQLLILIECCKKILLCWSFEYLLCNICSDTLIAFAIYCASAGTKPNWRPSTNAPLRTWIPITAVKFLFSLLMLTLLKISLNCIEAKVLTFKRKWKSRRIRSTMKIILRFLKYLTEESILQLFHALKLMSEKIVLYKKKFIF